ncbi:hypothetical protein [Neptunomonas marina]|uniref:Cds6 C-terminal domain-containing protein n=1 Tax=Neptunomonas marina TaxID=1815562 RepID=A0A437Q8F3_9GAMM|nr:hypothetical protein [Neptunomonas marina]RVU30777.1 hypothetical protein EOE65_10745 [Neptunomonas marina]
MSSRHTSLFFHAEQPNLKTNALAANDAAFLQRVLPEYGVALVPSARIAGLESVLEGHALTIMRPDAQQGLVSAMFEQLGLPNVAPEYRAFYLNRWAEAGGDAWLILRLADCNTAELAELLSLSPLNADCQFALKVILEGELVQLADPQFTELRQRVVQLERPVSTPPRPRPLAYRLAAGAIPLLTAAGLYGYLAVPEEPKQPIENAIVKSASISHQPVAREDAPVANIPTAALTRLVTDWSRAWQQRDIEAYFGFYLPAYSAYQHMSATQWRNWRTERLLSPEWIRIELGPLTFSKTEGGYRAEFWQLYRSPNYQDNTHKALLILPVGERFFIMDELNLDVRPVGNEAS